MPTRTRRGSLAGALALAALLGGAISLSAQPPVDPLKKLDPPKAEKPKDAKDAKPLVVKLPDGTFLWLGGASDGERVTLTPQEFQKLLDRVEALKKDLAARKPAPPSGCAIRARVEKRGDQLVASLKLTYTFRTTQANTAVLLGGRRTFLVSATLDGAKLPLLDTGDEGFAATVEAAGDHTLVLDVETPVTARGAKAEVGFDFSLPRAPITTLALDPPAGGVKRVNLATRTPDPALPVKADTRRLTNVDLTQFAAKDGHAGMPLGPVDSVEVTWDPPASAAQPADHVQSAEFDVTSVFSEGFLESTAKVKFRGPALTWKLVAPATADVTVERVAGATGDTGPTQQPVVTKPADSAKIVWKVEFPAGSSAADWAVTAVVRQPRPKSGAKSAAVPVGPFAALDVLRQTGTVKVTAPPHTRFVFKHGPDLRRAEPPGPPDEDNSVAFFRLTTGPTGATPVNAPLLTAEAWPVEGTVRVKPAYKLKLTEAGWQVRAEIAVKPIRIEVKTVVIDVPAEWRGLESESDSEIVENVVQGKAEGAWRPVTVHLAAGFKKPFDVILVGNVPAAPGAREAAVPFPRYPQMMERDSTVTATVPEGQEVHGTTRGWDGEQPAAWGSPMTALPGADGKVTKAVTVVSGKGELGLSRASLHWQPYRPDVTADVRADVTVAERQVIASQVIKLRAPDGFPKVVRFRGPAEALGLRAQLADGKAPALDSPARGVWAFAPPVDAKEVTLRLTYALPLVTSEDGPVSLPVGLFWPADVTRSEANVRVWVSSVTGRTVGASAAGWRELPPEPVPERDSLPAVTLAASAEYPLVLEVKRSTPDSAAAVQLSRTLIEAGMLEDGSVGYRARFRLQLYLTPAVEVILPDAVGPNPTARVDGVLAALVPVGGGDGSRRFRVTLPEGATRATVLEVNYTLPGSRHAFGETVYQPPLLASAVSTGGTRWIVTEPSHSAPLLLSNRGRAEMWWRPRGPTYAPTAVSHAAMDKWFVYGVEPGPGDTAGAEGEPVVLRQNAPEPVRVFRVPWLALVIACSLVAFVVLVALTWLPTVVSALTVVVLAAAFLAGVILYPQLACQLLAAAQPGFVCGAAAVALMAVIRWQVRRSVVHLPGFTRTLPDPSALTLPSASGSGAPPSPSARSRPGSTATPNPAATPSGT
jgi:hypothetical protein